MRGEFVAAGRAPLARTRTCSPDPVLRDCGSERRRLRRLAAAAGGAEPLGAVGAHRLDDRDERAALLGQLVLDARRDLGEGLAGDDALLLERAQAQAQRPGRDAFQRALQLAEALAAVGQVADHEERPLAADDVGGPADGAVGIWHVCDSSSRLQLLKWTSTDRSSSPRTTSSRIPSAASRASNSSSTEDRGRPLTPTRRSPRSTPAAAAGVPSCTPLTSRPSRWESPTAARILRAARAGASAMPSRGRSVAFPPASASARRCIAASAGRARISPPSSRIELSPSRRCSASTSGPPEDPRGSGAVCSSEPPIRRPRGPRNERPVALSRPNVARRPRPPGLASAITGSPMPTALGRAGSQAIGGASPVSTAIAARSRSASAPATRPSSVRPSANVTATSSPRSTWALVRTTPDSVTTPDPRPQPRPRPTTEGPTVAAAPATALLSSSMTDIDASGRVTCNLQVTLAERLAVQTRRAGSRRTAAWKGRVPMPRIQVATLTTASGVNVATLPPPRSNPPPQCRR